MKNSFKLFENLELKVNNQIITTKSTDAEYALTYYMNSRMNMPEAALTSTGALTGYWGKESWDSSHFAATLHKDGDGNLVSWDKNSNVDVRRVGAESIVLGNVPHFRYYITLKLNTGLATSPEPLPKDIPISIKLFRADAKRALLACLTEMATDTNQQPYLNVLKTYPHRHIPIVEPILHASYVVSDYYTRHLQASRVMNFKYKFNESSIQRYALNGYNFI